MGTQHRPGSGARRLAAVLGTAAALVMSVIVAAPAAQAADPVGFTCDPGAYQIEALNSGLTVEVSLASGNHGSVAQFGWNGGGNQVWRSCHMSVPGGLEVYRFINHGSGLCMSVDRRGLEAGTWVITERCDATLNTGNNAQEFWMLQVDGTRAFALSPQHTQNGTRMWLSAQDHSTAATAQIIQHREPELFRLNPIP
ncbi:RICIN domain-containing protein [Kitasatospora purpeofusca]|uniref:RICIN domain-containing protein n=1 Tax=Kitasatospora purpeofusca TaxID=67352 RepID=UPI0004C0D8A0|nr:RICIN domain-containing protein [Kitasatospora purpeofusca]